MAHRDSARLVGQACTTRDPMAPLLSGPAPPHEQARPCHIYWSLADAPLYDDHLALLGRKNRLLVSPDESP